MAKVYLAGPINGCSDEQANAWRERARELLVAQGFEVCDPMARDYRGREGDFAAELVAADLADIRGCDAVLVSCARPSWGTAMEVRFAHAEAHKFVVGFLPDPEHASPWLLQHMHVLERDLEAAVRDIVWNFRRRDEK